MFVDPTNVAYYLAERRLLSLNSVVDGDFTVVGQSSRNLNFKVAREHSPGFFIKQVRERTPQMTLTFAREAACYKLAREHKALAAMRPLMPDFLSYDERNYVLVLEALDGESLWEHHMALGSFPVDLAEKQGEKLGTYHGGVKITEISDEDLKIFPRQIPWILTLHESADIQKMSGGNAQLLSILREYPDFTRALGAIKRAWRFRVLTHGDIKWPNLMLSSGDIKVVDWEMADIGDDCWDAGAILQSYLTFWIFSLPLGPGVSIPEAMAKSKHDEEELKTAMSAFWESYATHRKLSFKNSRRLRERAMSCAAARMIQTAFETANKAPQLPPQSALALQMSLNILRDPAQAVRDFLNVGGQR